MEERQPRKFDAIMSSRCTTPLPNDDDNNNEQQQQQQYSRDESAPDHFVAAAARPFNASMAICATTVMALSSANVSYKDLKTLEWLVKDLSDYKSEHASSCGGCGRVYFHSGEECLQNQSIKATFTDHNYIGRDWNIDFYACMGSSILPWQYFPNYQSHSSSSNSVKQRTPSIQILLTLENVGGIVKFNMIKGHRTGRMQKSPEIALKAFREKSFCNTQGFMFSQDTYDSVQDQLNDPIIKFMWDAKENHIIHKIKMTDLKNCSDRVVVLEGPPRLLFWVDLIKLLDSRFQNEHLHPSTACAVQWLESYKAGTLENWLTC